MLINQTLINWKKVANGLSGLKSKVDKLDVDQLVPVHTDLSTLSNVVKNDIEKRCI